MVIFLKNIKVYVISHSEEDIQKIDMDKDIYVPLFVGRNGKDNLGYLSDDTGDNISYRNPNYCEMTGFYWMCKNSDADIIGLVHYRRYFSKTSFGKPINRQDIEEILEKYDLIIPEKNVYVKGNVYDNVGPNLIKHVDLAREAIIKLYPEYLDSFDKIMNNGELSFFNMFVGSKELMNQYSDWIFSILDELDDKFDLTLQPRLPGVLTELLFNVWIDHNNLKTKELKLRYLGTKLSLKMFIIKSDVVRKVSSPFYSFILNRFRKI